MLLESRNSVLSIGSKIVRSSFLKHVLPALGGRVVSNIFYLVNLKLVKGPIWISNCKKFCRQKLLNIDKTHDFVIKPLKI